MPNIIPIPCENPDELLNAGAYGPLAVIRVQTAATETGVYGDVAGTDSTPTLTIVAGQRVYTAYDPAGISSSWYRHRYENAAATRLSDWSAAYQVNGSAGIISLYGVRARLDLLANQTEHDAFLMDAIGAVTSTFHRRTGRWFLPDPVTGDVTYTFDIGWPSMSLVVRRGIRSITTLEYATVTGGDYATIPSTGYFLDPPEQDRDPGEPASQITLSDVSGYQFFPGKRTVRATGAFGMETPPPDLVQIAGNAIVRLFRARQAGQADTVGTNAMGQSIILRQLSPSELSTLDSYRWSRAD